MQNPIGEADFHGFCIITVKVLNSYEVVLMLHLEKKLFFIYNPHAGKENIKGKLYLSLIHILGTDEEMDALLAFLKKKGN